MQFNIININHAPVAATAVSDQQADEDVAFSFTIPADAFTDIDNGDVLSFSATLADGSALPGWLSFNAATRTFSGIPSNGDVGVLNVSVTATDKLGLTATDTFALDVQNVNDAPIVSVYLTTQNIVQGNVFSYSVPVDSFTDVDTVYGDTLTYSATLADGTALPAWLSFNSTTATFSGLAGDPGVLNVTVTATDSFGASASSTFNLDIAYTSTPGVVIVGTNANDILAGTEGDDSLDGQAGVDTLSGGMGNDTYIVDRATDKVVELAYQGVDTVQSTATYTLAANVENLQLLGTAALAGYGNGLNNIITGNSASNTLDGASGSDTLIGGIGNDTYVVDNAGDVVVENLGEGTDTVKSSVTYTLGDSVERLTLTGTADINGTGNDLNNVLTGNSGMNTLIGGAGNDTIDGGLGADTLIGLLGNDVYVVDNIGDVVTENLGEGTDRVNSAIDYTLTVNVENLTLTGVTAITGVGNELNNAITGNALDNTINGMDGNDTLNGGAGSDIMMGGLGNDVFVVDNVGDVVVENLGEGVDRVSTSVDYTLTSNVENLTLTGTVAISGVGNELNNSLVGNALDNILSGMGGNDTLNGGAGADAMTGGLGNDVYVVDNASDTVFEAVSEGIDTVQSYVDWNLGTNFENLTLLGTNSVNGFGNQMDNVITGNSAANWLVGFDGNDTLKGNGANDILQGGTGNDALSDVGGNNLFSGDDGADKLTGGIGNELFIGGTGNDTIATGNGADIIAFNRGDGMDTVNGGIGTDNTISLGKGINYADIALSKVNNNLILEVGAGEQITLTNWYNTAANYKSVIDLQVMADAMAAFDATSADPLLNQAVQNFDFTAIVNAFDQARGASTTFMHWSVTNSLLTSHLSGSDTTVLGGDLAHQYGTNGTLAGMNLTSAQTALNDPQFGAAQTLRPLQGLQGGAVTL